MSGRSIIIVFTGCVLGWLAAAGLEWAGVGLARRWALTVLITMAGLACLIGSRRRGRR